MSLHSLDFPVQTASSVPARDRSQQSGSIRSSAESQSQRRSTATDTNASDAFFSTLMSIAPPPQPPSPNKGRRGSSGGSTTSSSGKRKGNKGVAAFRNVRPYRPSSSPEKFSVPPKLMAAYANALESLNAESTQIQTRGLDDEDFQPKKKNIRELLAPPKNPQPRNMANGGRDYDDLREELLTTKSQLNALMQEKKTWQTKLAQAERRHNNMEKRFQEQLLTSVLFQRSENGAGTRGLGDDEPQIDDKFVTNLRTSLQRAEKTIERQNTQIEELKQSTKHRKLMEYQKEINKYYLEAIRLKRQLEHQQNGAAIITDDAETLISYDTAIHEFKEKLDEALEEGQQLREKGAKLEEQRYQHRKTIDSLQSQLQDLHNQHDGLQLEHKNLNKSYETLDDKFSNLEAKHQDLNEKHNIKSQEYDDLQEQSNQTVARLEDAHRQIKQAYGVQQQMQEVAASLTAERDQLILEVACERQEVARITREQQQKEADLMNQIGALREIIAQLHEAAERTKQQNIDLVGECQNYHTAFLREREIVQSMQLQLDATQQHVTNNYETIRSLERELSSSRERSSRLEDEVNMAYQKHDEVRNAGTRDHQMIQTLQQEIAVQKHEAARQIYELQQEIAAFENMQANTRDLLPEAPVAPNEAYYSFQMPDALQPIPDDATIQHGLSYDAFQAIPTEALEADEEGTRDIGLESNMDEATRSMPVADDIHVHEDVFVDAQPNSEALDVNKGEEEATTREIDANAHEQITSTNSQTSLIQKEPQESPSETTTQYLSTLPPLPLSHDSSMHTSQISLYTKSKTTSKTSSAHQLVATLSGSIKNLILRKSASSSSSLKSGGSTDDKRGRAASRKASTQDLKKGSPGRGSPRRPGSRSASVKSGKVGGSRRASVGPVSGRKSSGAGSVKNVGEDVQVAADAVIAREEGVAVAALAEVDGDATRELSQDARAAENLEKDTDDGRASELSSVLHSAIESVDSSYQNDSAAAPSEQEFDAVDSNFVNDQIQNESTEDVATPETTRAIENEKPFSNTAEQTSEEYRDSATKTGATTEVDAETDDAILSRPRLASKSVASRQTALPPIDDKKKAQSLGNLARMGSRPKVNNSKPTSQHTVSDEPEPVSEANKQTTSDSVIDAANVPLPKSVIGSMTLSAQLAFSEESIHQRNIAPESKMRESTQDEGSGMRKTKSLTFAEVVHNDSDQQGSFVPHQPSATPKRRSTRGSQRSILSLPKADTEPVAAEAENAIRDSDHSVYQDASEGTNMKNTTSESQQSVNSLGDQSVESRHDGASQSASPKNNLSRKSSKARSLHQSTSSVQPKSVKESHGSLNVQSQSQSKTELQPIEPNNDTRGTSARSNKARSLRQLSRAQSRDSILKKEPEYVVESTKTSHPQLIPKGGESLKPSQSELIPKSKSVQSLASKSQDALALSTVVGQDPGATGDVDENEFPVNMTRQLEDTNTDSQSKRSMDIGGNNGGSTRSLPQTVDYGDDEDFTNGSFWDNNNNNEEEANTMDGAESIRSGATQHSAVSSNFW